MTFPYSLLIFFLSFFKMQCDFQRKIKLSIIYPQLSMYNSILLATAQLPLPIVVQGFFFLFEVTSNPWSYAQSANEVIDQPLLTRFARLIFQDFSTLSALVLFTIKPCHDKTLQQFILEEEGGRTYKCVVFTRILLNLPRRVFPK